jgi:hypothetical protein
MPFASTVIVLLAGRTHTSLGLSPAGLAISVAPKPSAFNAATSAASIDASWEDGRGGAKAEAADGGYSRSEGKGVYKGRLVDERAAAQCQIDKSFLKSGICAMAFQFTALSRAAARRRGERAHENHRSRARRREYNLRSKSRDFFYLNRL